MYDYNNHMRLCSIKKILLLPLALCIIFPAFFTETLVIAEFDHFCIAEENDCRTKTEKEDVVCQPCLNIEAAYNFLKTFRPVFVVSSSLMPTQFTIQTSEKYSCLNTYRLSPVELKIRFNT